MKLRYLRHPIQTAKTAKATLTTQFNMWKFARHGERRFRGDVRYHLQNVTDGFISRINDSNDDTKILERICAAYNSAVRQQELAPETYEATERWRQVRQRSLGSVIEALLTRDVEALGKMYRNFFRDACSSGILAAPNGLSKAYFSGRIKDMHRHFYLSHVLYRLDYWRSQTNGRFTLQDLKGPEVGNPFGIVIDGILISVGAEYSHYCALKVVDQLDSGHATVAEIGGGFGRMAYYLLRDRRTTYVDFDVPERIALASYYLMKAFPALRFLLYGEETLTQETIAQADVVMMPAFELAKMPAGSVNVTFSSHGLSDLSSIAMVEYLKHIARMTRKSQLFVSNQRVSEMISSVIRDEHDSFRLTDTSLSGWHSYKISGAGVGGAAGLATSTVFEQCYSRSS
jgi:putative sugar O-methyltransferase